MAKDKTPKLHQTVGKWLRKLQTPEESSLHKSKMRHEGKERKRKDIAHKMRTKSKAGYWGTMGENLPSRKERDEYHQRHPSQHDID